MTNRNPRRRAQNSKPAKSGNYEMWQAMSDLRRSSAASPHKSGKAYTRKARTRRDQMREWND